MDINFIQLIKFLAVFQAFLFALYLLSNKKNIRFSNYFIALFLILFGVNLASDVLDLYISSWSPNTGVFLMMTIFLAAPALYLYILTSSDPHFKLSWKTGLHLLPFVFFNILIIPNVYLENLRGETAESEIHNSITMYFFVFFYLQNFTYLILSYSVLRKNKQLYFESSSNTDTRKYKYLFQLNSIVLFVFIFSAIKNFMLYNIEGVFLDYAVNIVLFSILVLFCWIILMALRSPELFQKSEENLPLVKYLIKEKQFADKTPFQSKTSLVIDEEIRKQVEEVKSYMEIEEPFLDASLTLYDLAKQTMKPARELSILINHYLNKHFFDFVNEYRIKKAMEFLKAPDKKDYTVLEILYDVGFNSKSSFNTAFKKQTGYTPTEYRKSHVNVPI